MNLSKILQSYGLSEKQAKVYLACLELGSASVVKISAKAGLPRSTVYEILEHLSHEGFVSTFNKKKIKYFSAEDPAQIVRLAESKVNILRDVLPQLNAIAGQFRKRPTVRFYQGKDEMKLILEEILDEADILLAFGSADDLFRELESFHKFVEKRIKNKIPLRVILEESELAKKRQALGQKHLRQVKIVPSVYSFHGVKYIWKNKVAMFSFTGDLVCVVIESKELIDMEKAMFNHLWDRS